METYLIWTLGLVVIGLMASAGAWLLRTLAGGSSPSAMLFKPKGERRLSIVEYVSIDARRRLVLVRRDDTEHLLLTGGVNDLVVETGLPARPAPEHRSGEKG